LENLCTPSHGAFLGMVHPTTIKCLKYSKLPDGRIPGYSWNYNSIHS